MSSISHTNRNTSRSSRQSNAWSSDNGTVSGKSTTNNIHITRTLWPTNWWRRVRRATRSPSVMNTEPYEVSVEMSVGKQRMAPKALLRCLCDTRYVFYESGGYQLFVVTLTCRSSSIIAIKVRERITAHQTTFCVNPSIDGSTSTRSRSSFCRFHTSSS